MVDRCLSFARVSMMVALLPLTSTLTAGTSSARTWHVPSEAPTIQAGIDFAMPGDDVLVAPGTYREHDIPLIGGILVHSEQGASATIIDGGGAGRVFDELSQPEETIIEGFTITNGYAEGEDLDSSSGGGIRSLDSNLVVRSCVFDACGAHADGGAVFVRNSTITIEASTIHACTAYSGAGIWAPIGCRLHMTDTILTDNEDLAVWAAGPEVVIRRCVFARNRERFGNSAALLLNSHAFTLEDCLFADHRNYLWDGITVIAIYYASGTVSGCTLVDNALTAENPAIEIYQASVDFDRTLIAFNEGSAMACLAPSTVTVRCSDFYGNAAGNGICGDDLGGNFSADPLFCGAEIGDYTLDAASPCLPGNHPGGMDCGLIGARGLGCGATPVAETTWGRVRALFRVAAR